MEHTNKFSAKRSQHEKPERQPRFVDRYFDWLLLGFIMLLMVLVSVIF